MISISFEKSFLSSLEVRKRHFLASRHAGSCTGFWGCGAVHLAYCPCVQQQLLQGKLCQPKTTKKRNIWPKTTKKSSQQTALLAAEFVGVSVRPGPATEQWARRPQYEESDKERWGPLLSRALCLSRGSDLAPYCMFPLYKAFSLSSCKLQQPWLSC